MRRKKQEDIKNTKSFKNKFMFEILRICLIVFIIGITNINLWAENKEDNSEVICDNDKYIEQINFAKSLLDGGKYYIAISEYKRALEKANNKKKEAQCYIHIAIAYHNSKNYVEAIKLYYKIKRNYAGYCDIKKIDLYLSMAYIGNNNIKMGMHILNEVYYKNKQLKYEETILYLLGWCEYYKRNFDNLRKNWILLLKKYPKSKYRIIVNKYIKKLQDDYDEKSKNIFASVGLSLCMPGLGQMYADHYSDGFIYLGFTGFFGAMTYYSITQEKHVEKSRRNFTIPIVLISITTYFYLSNLIVSSQLTLRRNELIHAELWNDYSEKLTFWKIDNDLKGASLSYNLRF